MAIRVGGCLLLIGLCLGLSATAAVIEKLSIHTLSQKSDLIAIGRIIRVDTVLENGEPWTVTTLVLDKQMKGERKASVQFRLPGGIQKINGRTLVTQVEGFPVPTVNQRALIFLSGRQEGRLALTGMGQGFWRVDVREGKEVAKASDDAEAPALELDYVIQRVQRAIREAK